jgi:hypothetical protein
MYIYLFINAVGYSDYNALHKWANNELERTSNEDFVASRHVPGGTEESLNKFQPW